MKRILMSGITGLVGSAFATELLWRDKNTHIIALARGQGNKNAEIRVEEAIKEQCEFDGRPEFAPKALERIEVLKRNISSHIPSKSIENLKDIDSIFHCAADVNLGKDPFGKTYINNYQGTKNMLKTAQKLGVKNFHMVSTAYVAGKAEGIVYEDGLVPNIGFNNAYEKSKYNSETLVRESGLTYSIYRPSIVVGRIKDGKIRKPLAFYRILEFLAKLKKQQCAKLNLPPNAQLEMDLRLVTKKSDKIYFVPIDYVQKAITELYMREPKNKTYHITGRGPGSVNDIEIVIKKALKIDGLSVVEKVDKQTIKEKLIHKFLGDLLPYFASEITFDIQNVID
ncbi:MAG: NAD-dependent epimerase/dehydratase family protein, partial [bacterium]|nr:NAD-dependent epimerase/dehydratase family protein [bacterium]